MVNTRRSQQSNPPSGMAAAAHSSDDSSEDEVLDLTKRKQAAIASGRSLRRFPHGLTNGHGHSHEGERAGAADTATATSSQRVTRNFSRIYNNDEYQIADRQKDRREGGASHESHDADYSPGRLSEGFETDPDQSQSREDSQDEENDQEADETPGRRRSKRQMEKAENQSWLAMNEPSARGYRGYRTRGAASASEAQGEAEREVRENREDPDEEDYVSEGLYTRIKTSGRPRRRSSAYNTTSGASNFSPRKLEPIASRLRVRGPKSYNVTEAYRRIFRQPDKRGSQARRGRGGDDSDSSDDDVPRKRKKAILISNDGSQQFAGGIEGFMPIKPDTSINFTSVGGLNDFVQKIREVILFPLLYKPFYDNRRITPPRGLLLYGPPGTGKTLLARAIAGEATRINGKPVSFFMLKGSEVQTKWVGESEKALRELFKTATACAPSIIFFDEFDGLAASRSIKTDQFHNSLVSTFLAELDGLRDRGQIIVIGATNRIEAIDPAFRRAGRLDFELQFRLPDYNARREIITIHTRDWPDAPAGREMEELTSLTAGYNGADLKLICSQACLNALKRRYPQIYKRKEKLAIDYDSVKVTHVDFVEALEVVPRSSFRSTLAMTALPLPELLKPLLQRSVDTLKARIDYIFQIKNSGLISPSRKRILIFGDSQYIVPAVLYRMDTLTVSAISTQSITLSESEARAILAAFSEASVKRGVLYIQDIDKVYKMLNPMGRLVLHQELNKVDDVSLVLATSTDPVFPEELVEFFENCQFQLLKTTNEERHQFFQKIFNEDAYRVRVEVPPVEEEELDVAEADDLSEEDLRAIEKRENRMLRGLRIFLREILQKLARNRKFAEFTTPVNLSEAPDYFEIIQNPMDFEKMMGKVNNGEYLHAKMFLGDIELICENAHEYNSPATDFGKQIRLKASALRDEAQDLIDRELDSDFEADCERIATDREERKRCHEENIRANEARRRAPSVKRRKSRDNNRDSNVTSDINDLGFRKTPNSVQYRHQLENYLRRIVEATEKSTLLEMTALCFQLSCECQRYYDSEDKSALVAEIRKIVRSIEEKRLQQQRQRRSPSPDSDHSLEVVPATPSTIASIAPLPSSTPQPRIIQQTRRLSYLSTSSTDSDKDLGLDLASNSSNLSNTRPRRRINGHV